MTDYPITTAYLGWPTTATAMPNAASDWPINEVLLQALEARGLSDMQIAERYDVAWQQVAALRESMG